MLNCKYCRSELEANASFCGFCGQATSITIDEYTRHSNAIYSGSASSQENNTFISPAHPAQVRSQQFSVEHVSNDAPCWSNASYGNPDSQESTALVRPPIFLTQDGRPAPVCGTSSTNNVSYVRGTPPPPTESTKISGATHTADPLAHQYPQQAVHLHQTFTPINHRAPTVPSPAAAPARKARKGPRSTGLTIAISALLLAIAIVAPLFYMAVTHASASSGLINCPAMSSSAKINLGPLVEGQSQPLSSPFTLCTQGTGTVTWTSSWDQQQAPWLQIDHSGQIAASQTQNVTISATSAHLKAGTYTTTVTFSTQNQTKVLLDVTLDVKPGTAPTPVPTVAPTATPVPTVAPTATPVPTIAPTATPVPTNTPVPAPCLQGSATLNFTAVVQQKSPPAQSVQLKNACGPGNWQATSSDTSWLNATPASGKLSGNDSFKVDIAVTSSGLNANTYNGTVTFSDGKNTALVNVTLTVTSPACIKNLNPAALNLTVAPGGSTYQQVTFNNPCGAGNWSASSDKAWLSASPNTGTLSGSDTVTSNIAVDASNLSQGTYSSQVTFNDSVNTLTVSVTLTVQAKQVYKTPTSTPTPSPSPTP